MSKGFFWSKGAALLFSGSVVFACAAPSQPPLIASGSQGAGHIIQDCQNIEAGAKIEMFKTTSYLTTWSSAWREGASAGVQSGLLGPDPHPLS